MFGQQVTTRLPWKEFSPGLYAVGYKVIFAFDRSRTWRATRTGKDAFAADLTGRPVRISVWYPAAPRHTATMRILDYIQPASPAGFMEANAALERRDRRVMAEMVPPNAFESLLNTRMQAHARAVPAEGKFPLVLYFGGINAYTLSNGIMAEVLASHGYIVVTVPSLGPTNAQTEQSYSPAQMESAIRDLEFAWSRIRNDSNVDDPRIAVFGHSLGGTMAMILAMRNANVLAAAGLDGTYGFNDGFDTLTGYYGYAPDRMRAAVLDLRRETKDLNLTAVHAFQFSDRFLVTLSNVLHGDFTTFIVVARAFHLPPPSDAPVGRTIETGYLGFKQTCTIIRWFLDATMKGNQRDRERLVVEMRARPNVVVSHEASLPP